MQDFTELKKNLKNYTDDEFVRYIKEYIFTITNDAFKLVKSEIEKRPTIHNQIDFIKIEQDRKQKFINDLPKLIVSNINTLKSVEDMISFLKDGSQNSLAIDELLYYIVELLEKLIDESKKKTNIGLIWLVGGSLLTLFTITNPIGDNNTTYFFYGAIFYGLYSISGMGKTSKFQDLRDSIRKSLKLTNYPIL